MIPVMGGHRNYVHTTCSFCCSSRFDNFRSSSAENLGEKQQGFPAGKWRFDKSKHAAERAVCLLIWLICEHLCLLAKSSHDPSKEDETYRDSFFWCFFGDTLLEIVMKLAANYPLILESLSLL